MKIRQKDNQLATPRHPLNSLKKNKQTKTNKQNNNNNRQEKLSEVLKKRKKKKQVFMKHAPQPGDYLYNIGWH